MRTSKDESDAKTHRTPKALRAKCMETPIRFRGSFRSAHSSSRRLCFVNMRFICDALFEIVKSKMIPSALDHIDEIIAAPGKRIALFLDYDGTLTPIVSHPEKASLSDSARMVLRALASKVPIAVLSGRDLDDIRHRVDIGRIVYAGSHGFDIAGPRGLRKQVATELVPIIDAAEKELNEKLAGVRGVMLERKRFSIAAHYRQAHESDTIKVQRAANEVEAHYCKLRLLPGKKVYELQPDVHWDKGRAVVWILESLVEDGRGVFPIYIGDDLTDEDAFHAIRERGIGIVVSEQPCWTAARYMLRDPAEVERFLRELVTRVRAGADL